MGLRDAIQAKPGTGLLPDSLGQYGTNISIQRKESHANKLDTKRHNDIDRSRRHVLVNFAVDDTESSARGQLGARAVRAGTQEMRNTGCVRPPRRRLTEAASEDDRIIDGAQNHGAIIPNAP